MSNATVKTLSESAYAQLRDDIIAGRLAPQAKLRIEELRQDYQTSASPLREALNRLAGEGFVTAEGQRGFRVAPVSLKDLNEITRLRILLESEAIRESIRYGDTDWEASILAAFHRMSKADAGRDENIPEWEARNDEFHEALIAACDSKRLLNLRRSLYEQHKRYRLISILEHDESRDVGAEHRAIMEAALARNAAAACKATETHIMRTVEVTERALLHLTATDQERESVSGPA